MKADWSPLRRELALWRSNGLALPMWWRDDDAVVPTPELEQLTRLSQELGLQVHLAVIPAQAQKSLADFLAEPSPCVPIVHGWAHQNNAPPGAKKAEFGHPRPASEHELKEALAIMRALFGAKLIPAFVAPWNRLHPSYEQVLRDLGYEIVSTFLARNAAHPVPGLLSVNTHVDPINWRGSRGLVEPAQIIDSCVSQLQARRTGDADILEPFGYLTHHLVHTKGIWDFSRAFLSEMLEGGATPTSLAAAMKETK